MENKYIDRVAEIIYDEQKIVTYKWLSKDQKISMDLAKKVLQKFFDENKTKNSKLAAVYCVIGLQIIGDNEIQKVCIVPENSLEKLKQSMKIISSHVYSIQQCKLQDSSTLYITDLNEKFDFKCSIRCQELEHHSEKHLSTEEIASATDLHSVIKNQPDDLIKETDEQNIAENAPQTIKKNADNKQKNRSTEKQNNIAFLFQNKALKQLSQQNKVETKLKVTESKDDNDKKNNEEEKGQIKKKIDNKITKKRLNTDSEKKTMNKHKNDHEITEKQTRKRIRVFTDDSSESEEGNDENIEDYSLQPEEDEDPIPSKAKKLIADVVVENDSQTSNKETILHQKFVSYTFKDDEDDYLVTKRVLEMVEEPESLPHETNKSEKSVSAMNTSENTLGKTNKLSLAQRNKKNSSQQKQSSLMNYFKKSF